jgi:superfamily II DNA or RNA helicase
MELLNDMRAHDVTVVTPQFLNIRFAVTAIRSIILQSAPIFDLHIYDECHYLPTNAWQQIWATLSGEEGCSVREAHHRCKFYGFPFI